MRTDAPPKVEKVHVLPHLPVVVRNALSFVVSAFFTAAAATTSAAATAEESLLDDRWRRASNRLAAEDG